MSDESTFTAKAKNDLPSIQDDPNRPSLNELNQITRQSTLNEHVDADLSICHTYLEGLHYAMGQTKSIDSLCKLVSQGLNVIQARRQLALRPTHAADHKNPKAFGFEHID